jgi:hypothetical protein
MRDRTEKLHNRRLNMKRQRIPFLVALLAFSVNGFITEASAQNCSPSEAIPPAFTGVKTIDSRFVTITVEDTGSGICRAFFVEAKNVRPVGTSFDVVKGIPKTILIIEKGDVTKRASFKIQVVDCCNNSATFDPVFTSVIRATAKPRVETFTDLPEAEGFITLVNGTPGLRRLVAIVNGESFVMQGLKDGEEVTLDVTSAMEAGSQNIVALVGYGKPGGSASVMIWEGPTN